MLSAGAQRRSAPKVPRVPWSFLKEILKKSQKRFREGSAKVPQGSARFREGRFRKSFLKDFPYGEVPQGSAGFREVPPGSAGFRKVPQGAAGFRRVPQGSARFRDKTMRNGTKKGSAKVLRRFREGSTKFLVGVSLA